MIIYNAKLNEEAGYGASMLRGAGGSSKAQHTLLETADSLEEAGYDASMLRGNAGSSKAQHTLLETTALLEGAGFTPDQVSALLMRNNASAKVQKIIVSSITKLTSWGFLPVHITAILKGSAYTSGKIINAITAVCEEAAAKRSMTHAQIVYYVRQGGQDRNRKKVAREYLQHHSG